MKTINEQVNRIKDLMGIKEDINSLTDATVYHRTTPTHVETIFKEGKFKIGQGQDYGPGIYGVYELDSINRPEMSDYYGPFLIEVEVVSMDKFLVLDYDVARKVYGEDYKITSQFNNIIGDNWRDILPDFVDDDSLSLIDELPENKAKDNTYKILKTIEKWLPDLRNYFNGAVFSEPTSMRNGRVLVSFNVNNMIPKRFSIDNGKTWVDPSGHENDFSWWNEIRKEIYK
jgi:hypothetical protein